MGDIQFHNLRPSQRPCLSDWITNSAVRNFIPTNSGPAFANLYLLVG
jgi:hypothetical protein